MSGRFCCCWAKLTLVILCACTSAPSPIENTATFVKEGSPQNIGPPPPHLGLMFPAEIYSSTYPYVLQYSTCPRKRTHDHYQVGVVKIATHAQSQGNS